MKCCGVICAICSRTEHQFNLRRKIYMSSYWAALSGIVLKLSDENLKIAFGVSSENLQERCNSN